MNKKEITLDNLHNRINEFYDKTQYHFLTLNGVALDENTIEVQWIFTQYDNENEIIVFFAKVDQNDIIPSIVDLIPSAIISQRELVDMFGLSVEDTEKGLYLDEDSLQKPLSLGCGI